MASTREEAIAANDAEIGMLRAQLLVTLQRHRHQLAEQLVGDQELLLQQPRQDEIQQQPQQDGIQQQRQRWSETQQDEIQQHHQQLDIQQDEIQQHHQQDETTSTASAIIDMVGAAVAAPTWTLNAMGVPVGVAKSGGGVTVDAAAPSAAAVGGDGVDEEYERTRTMANKWRVRHDMLAEACLNGDAERARKLARKMYAGPPLGYT